MRTKVICTKNLDPWRNLAMEEYLLDRVEKEECIFYLWQNQNTVVIGKNQNPWQECRTELLEREGGKLARRISGGGAVYHDIGNLNFSFLVDREAFDITRQLEVILTALNKIGIDGKFSGRNDLTVEDRKFSGNAFCYRKTSALHHGTILISADMEKMTRYLQVSQEKIRSKGIESVKARVVNLVEYSSDLNIDKMKKVLIEAFSEVYGEVDSFYDNEEAMDQKELESLYQKYSSWEWRFGESPRFDIEMRTRFPWGGLEIGLQLVHGRIDKAYVYSDAMDEAFIEMLPEVLEGCAFQSSEISDAIYAMDISGEKRGMAMDIAEWIRDKEF